jgi:peptide/nickel transport system permease protein
LKAVNRGRGKLKKINFQIILGVLVIAVMSSAAIMAPIVANYDPLEVDLSADARLQAPSMKHFFGTDNLGRDVFSRMVYGARISLSVGFIAVAISLFIGLVLGGISGYYGGRIDGVIMRAVEVMYCFPTFFLIMMVITFIGPSIVNVMVVIGFTSWPGLCRLVRAEFLTLRERDFVSSAKVQGVSDARIIFRHILPNAMAPVYVSATLSVGGAILVESALSFLGLGVQIPEPSWGNILTAGKSYMDYAWWLTLFPGLAILFTVLSFNLIGEGLRDMLDPKMSKDRR